MADEKPNLVDTLMDIADGFRAAGMVGSPANNWDIARQKFVAALAPILAAMKKYDNEHHSNCAFIRGQFRGAPPHTTKLIADCDCGYEEFKAAIALLQPTTPGTGGQK